MVTLKTGLRELVRECFKVKSVVINRLGIGSSSPWILFGMKGTSRSSTLYFGPVYFSRLKLYFDSNDCEDRNATQFSGEMFFICSRNWSGLYSPRSNQQPIFQQDRLSFRESVLLLLWDNPGYFTPVTIRLKFVNSMERPLSFLRTLRFGLDFDF